MYKEYFYHIPFIDEKVSFILWNVITPKTRVVVDQGPLSEIWWCLSRVDKTKKFRVYSKFASNGRKSFILKPVLQKGTPSCGWGQDMDQGSMDPLFGPVPWTTFHGPLSMDPLSWTRSMDSFLYFYKKVLHQVQGHSKTEIVSKKDLTRRCRPMLTIDHKYLVVLTWRTLCLHMCSRKTVKLSY